MAAKIMLVEDDTNLTEIYKARLEAEGYQITSATDGEEALAMAVKDHPDLIISDIMMPKISGFDMLDILRATPGVEATKVIMMTALGQTEDKSRAEKLGADRYLVKSQVTLEDVVKTVHEILEGPTEDSTPVAPADISTPQSPPVTPVSPPPVELAVTPTPMATESPAPSALPTSPTQAIYTPTPTPSPTPEPSPSVDPTVSSNLSQSSEEETSNISTQIQDFLNPTPVDMSASNPSAPISTPTVIGQVPPPITPEPVSQSDTPQPTQVINPTTPTVPTPDMQENNYVSIANKKTIAPDSTPRPDINTLLAKEEAQEVKPVSGQVVTSDQVQDTSQIDPNSIAL